MHSDLQPPSRRTARGQSSLLAAFVALNLAVMLAGCGGGGAAPGEEPLPVVDAPQEQAPPTQERPAVPTAVGEVTGNRAAATASPAEA